MSALRRTPSDKRGLTIVELLVVLAVLSLVLGVGYNLYSFGTESFTRGETQWIVQREVRSAADYIAREVRYAYQLSIHTGSIPSNPGEHHYIFRDGGSYVHRYRDDTGTTQTRVIPGGAYCTVSFQRVADVEDEVNEWVRNLLSFTVRANDVDYEVESAVFILNMPTASIEGVSPSGAIRFSKTSVEEIMENPQPPPGGCFIATAAYGSPAAPSVAVLREFRDRYLVTNTAGKAFVQFYYRHSPAVADRVAASDPLRAMVRAALVPVTGVAYLALHPEAAAVAVLTLSLVVFAVGGKYRRGQNLRRGPGR